MRRYGIFAAAIVVTALSIAGCSDEGSTPFFQGSQENVTQSDPSSAPNSDEGNESLSPNAPSSGDTEPSGPSNDSSKDTQVDEGDPTSKEGPVVTDENDSPYGESDINEPVLLGQEGVPDDILSPEEMKKIEEDMLKEFPDDSESPNRVTDSYIRGANDSFNGVMSLISERRYTEACEKYVYLPEGETIDSCAGKLQISYPNIPDATPMTKENTNLVVWDKEYITAALKDKGRDESQQLGYFLVDGVWKGMFI